MPLLERAAHVFILRLWQEPREVEAPAIWRGWIEHVASREGKYFSTLEEALLFIVQSLAADQSQEDSNG
jgi:hypothetical protein